MDYSQMWATAVVISWIAFLYFLPAFVAWRRHHHNTVAILVLNALTGWTLLGWIFAMVWAWTRPTPVQVHS